MEELILGAVVFIFVDMKAYGWAKWPERQREGMWPGSGIYALLCHGRSKDTTDPRENDDERRTDDYGIWGQGRG